MARLDPAIYAFATHWIGAPDGVNLGSSPVMTTLREVISGVTTDFSKPDSSQAQP
jgi:hypothetical protein